MRLPGVLRSYSVRLLEFWIFWFWFFALDALGLVIDTFVPTFSPPRWLYVLIAVLGFLVGNIKLFAESESQERVLESRILVLEATLSDPMARLRSRFQELADMMPQLIAEMREDLTRDPFVREFFTLTNKGVMNYGHTPRLTYYYEEHGSLDGKVQILENMGFVHDTTVTQARKYRMTEEFVKLLLADATDVVRSV